MKSIFSVVIDKESTVPIYQQLGNCLQNFIETEVLKPDAKLPPIRQMADLLKINNDTVINAYKYLENKKLVYSVRGSGTYVSPLKVNPNEKTIIKQNFPIQDAGFLLEGAINFSGTYTNKELFPVKDFKFLFNHVLDRDKSDAFSFEGNQGYLPLRKEIVSYLTEFKIQADVKNIYILSGAWQGLDIAARNLLTYGDNVIVESPTFYGAAALFSSRGANVIEVPITLGGIDLKELENNLKIFKPKLIYVMTSFQTPTGISYDLYTKRSLLALAEKYNTYILEEDSLSDFNYTKENIIPLKALDYKNRVIYLKSFSKILMPGLKLGFMVIPSKIAEPINYYLDFSDINTYGFIQRAFSLFMEQGYWNKHREKMIQYYQRKYTLMEHAIHKYLYSQVQFTSPKGGLSFWLTLKKPVEESLLLNNLIQSNVIVSPGSLYFNESAASKNLRISFSDVSDKNIERGMEILSLSLRNT